MKAKIIAIGSELLEGRTVDTNSAFMAGRLQGLGIEPVKFETCPDDFSSIAKALEEDPADIILVTGGLGPTDDDLTREAVKMTFGMRLVKSRTAVKDMKRFFKKRGRKITARNLSQGLIPEGSRLMRNLVGTAPGFIFEKNGTVHYVFPGVPHELKEMFDKRAVPDLKKRFGVLPVRKSITLKMFGMPEAGINDIISGLKKPKDVSLGFYPTFPEVHLKISFYKERGRSLRGIDRYVHEIRKKFAAVIFAEDEARIEEKLVDALIKNKLTLSIAESATGGLLASSIVGVPGSSRCFERGFVTYSNRSKIEELGVCEETIKRYGAVSRQCALEMAEGARRISKTDIGISTTGIAGPTGATAGKPLGTTFIGISAEGVRLSEHFLFNAGRNKNRILAMYGVFKRLLDLMDKKEICR